MREKLLQRLAGAVILYNPEANVIDNAKSYLANVDHLYVVDNAAGAQVASAIKKLAPEKVTILTNSENEGIAKPLNAVLHRAYDEGYELLLTMDQDSRFFEGHMSLYRKSLSEIDWEKCFGLGPTSVALEPCENGKGGGQSLN